MNFWILWVSIRLRIGSDTLMNFQAGSSSVLGSPARWPATRTIY